MSRISNEAMIFSPQEDWSLELFDRFVGEIDESLRDRASSIGWLLIKNGIYDGFPGLSISKVGDDGVPHSSLGAAKQLTDFYSWGVFNANDASGQPFMIGNDDDLDAPQTAMTLAAFLALGNGKSRIVPTIFIAKTNNDQS